MLRYVLIVGRPVAGTIPCEPPDPDLVTELPNDLWCRRRPTRGKAQARTWHQPGTPDPSGDSKTTAPDTDRGFESSSWVCPIPARSDVPMAVPRSDEGRTSRLSVPYSSGHASLAPSQLSRQPTGKSGWFRGYGVSVLFGPDLLRHLQGLFSRLGQERYGVAYAERERC